MQELARQLPRKVSPLLLLFLIFFSASSILAAAELQQQQQQQHSVPYSYQPLSAHAIPTVAIIGTAKAGTTDLYTLLTRTSQLAPGGQKKRKYTHLLLDRLAMNSSSSSGGGGCGSELLSVLF
jgi:hypothetical protein